MRRQRRGARAFQFGRACPLDRTRYDQRGMGTGSNRAVIALWIGPGARLAELRPFLAAALAGEEPSELEDFIQLPEREAIVLVDGDALRAEDCTDLARYLARSASSRVLVLADDPARRGVRALLRSDRVRWIPWPPDVDDLREIADLSRNDSAGRGPAHPLGRADTSRSHAPTRPSPTAGGNDRTSTERGAAGVANAPPRDAGANALSREIEEIERVLGADALDEEGILSRPEDLDSEPGADARVATREFVSPDAPLAPRSTAARTEDGENGRDRSADAGAFRAQVADLADIAQRIELTLEGARAEPGASTGDRAADTALDAVAREVARLVQFARTLGYLVAPPARGAQRFDLGEMLEVFLSDIRGSGPDAPRCLLRSNGPLPVISDRRLLGQAFDALFFLARNAATRGEVLRVQALRDDDARPPLARVTIDFPADRLSEIAPEEIVAPYGLRRVFPELGPNALSAATRIIEGQGGRCRLDPLPRARLEWTVTLPLASAPANSDERTKSSSAHAGERARPSGDGGGSIVRGSAGPNAAAAIDPMNRDHASGHDETTG
jgi:hypothetical protein